MRTKEKDILLALAAAQDQLLWTRDLLRWEGTTANEKVKQGTKEALEALEETLGIAALDTVIKEAGDFDLCNELRRYMSCDHCPFNDKYGRCWISNVEQNEEGWKDALERWTSEVENK